MESESESESILPISKNQLLIFFVSDMIVHCIAIIEIMNKLAIP
jgi:hypothetical protein